MATGLASLHSTLRLLADPVRQRLCALLARAELAVQELVTVTGLQQSRISNHLSLLKRAGLVRDRREGTWSFHSLCEPAAGGPLTPQLFAGALVRVGPGVHARHVARGDAGGRLAVRQSGR